MTGPPDRDSYRNVQVCSLCVVDNTEYGEMFPVVRIVRKAAMADVVKLVQKFGGAKVDDDTLSPYAHNALAMQTAVYEKMKIDRALEAEKRAVDFTMRSEVLRARIKAGRI